jgi:hypothetical protein
VGCAGAVCVCGWRLVVSEGVCALSCFLAVFRACSSGVVVCVWPSEKWGVDTDDEKLKRSLLVDTDSAVVN